MCDHLIGTIWITGITASGKTTLGELLYNNLKGITRNKVEFFDGDILRKRVNINGFTVQDRYKKMKKYVDIVRNCNEKNKIAIISTVTHKKEMRLYARRHLPVFMEIFLNCDPNICRLRDYKGLYKRALAGECDVFPGVTEPYEVSDVPELILDTGRFSVDECSHILFSEVKSFFKLGTGSRLGW